MKIALIAQDGKKADMVAFVMKRLDFFKTVDIVATGTTGTHVENAGLKKSRRFITNATMSAFLPS